MAKRNQLRQMQNIYFFVCLFVILFGLRECRHVQSNIFLINQHSSEIHLDGDVEEIEWEGATSITNFHSPWVPTERDSTIFRCFCSQGYFNFCFEVIDRSLKILDYTDEMTITKGDRVELFFSPSSKLSSYYCIEINPYGHILDYKAQFYRKFDYSWNFSHYNIVGKVTLTGYVVEGCISLNELDSLNINFDKGFYMGIFRADFTEENEDSPTWYSWINPHTKHPDFHIQSAFIKSRLNQF